MSEHTPGPWFVKHRNCNCTQFDDEKLGMGLDLIGPPEPLNDGQFAKSADARLAAAAPLMLAALEAVEWLDEDNYRGAQIKECPYCGAGHFVGSWKAGNRSHLEGCQLAAAIQAARGG